VKKLLYIGKFGLPNMAAGIRVYNLGILFKQLDIDNEGVAFVTLDSNIDYSAALKEVIEKLGQNTDYIGCIVGDVSAINRINEFRKFFLVLSDKYEDMNAKTTINKLNRLDKRILGSVNVEQK